MFYSPRLHSPRSSMGESVRSSFQEGSPEALEAVILSRVNAICQPSVYAKARQAQVISFNPGRHSDCQLQAVLAGCGPLCMHPTRQPSVWVMSCQGQVDGTKPIMCGLMTSRQLFYYSR